MTTSYFYFSVLSSNSRHSIQHSFQKQSLWHESLNTVANWDTLAQCIQEVKFHLKQQLNILTSHKPQRAPQTATEVWCEKKRWQLCWKTFSTLLHVCYLLFCKESERWSEYQIISSVPRKPGCFPPPFSVDK